MMNPRDEQLDELLGFVAAGLEVPESVRQDIVQEYDRLAAWIREDNRDRFSTDSEVYPQGSIRIGTMICPVHANDDCDADLVYLRHLAKSGVSQRQLMESAGEQLTRYRDHRIRQGASLTLERGRRCWTLRFGTRFHLDVLPAIPDEQGHLTSVRGAVHAILVTDKKLYRWQPSNPREYAAWFDETQATVLHERRVAMAKSAIVDVEEIPEDTVPTPLRQFVKFAKRHRDVRYDGPPEDKPISIIITTLAARAYRGETSLSASARVLAQRMEGAIEVRDGEYWVENPINPKENFADKWNEEEHAHRRLRFLEWLRCFAQDLEALRDLTGLDEIQRQLAVTFGEPVSDVAIANYGKALQSRRRAGALFASAGTAQLGAAGRMPVRGHEFFGLPPTSC